MLLFGRLNADHCFDVMGELNDVNLIRKERVFAGPVRLEEDLFD